MIGKTDWILKLTLIAIAIFLGIIAFRPMFDPQLKVQAQAATFEHVLIVSNGVPYKGSFGMLVLDKRNGNVWFYPKVNDVFQDPVFVVRLQFEKLDRPTH